MAKEDTLERRSNERENPPSKVVSIFSEHFELALKSMSAEHAAASAHDAVQRHIASARESSGVPEPPSGFYRLSQYIRRVLDETPAAREVMEVELAMKPRDATDPDVRMRGGDGM